MNSTETPGGSGIPAGWYDDPSGEGLRWWDGERWTEHVHTAESAVAATSAVADEGEGKPPRDLVKLRESIRERGVKAVGMVLGGVVVVIVVIALLVSGGSDNTSGGAEPGAGAPGTTNTNGTKAATQAQIKKINRELKNQNLSPAQRKKLQAQKKKLQGGNADKGTQQGE